MTPRNFFNSSWRRRGRRDLEGREAGGRVEGDQEGVALAVAEMDLRAAAMARGVVMDQVTAQEQAAQMFPVSVGQALDFTRADRIGPVQAVPLLRAELAR